jgi:diaminopimelate decarboxylase
MVELDPILKFNLNRVRDNARRFHSLAQKFWTNDQYKVFYAVKANPDEKILRILSEENFGFEVMTNLQLNSALAYSSKIISSGFYKKQNFIESSIGKVKYIVVEGIHDFLNIKNALTKLSNQKIAIALRIKLEPTNKIGFSVEEIISLIPFLRNNKIIQLSGLHFHSGWNVKDESQVIKYLQVFKDVYELLVKNFINLEFLNLGGSFCEHSSDSTQLEKRIRLYADFFKNTSCQIHFEPGRYLVGDAGNLYAQITYVNHKTNEIIVNTCAYGYKLNAGTPKGQLLNIETGSTQKWDIFGFWPAEGDRCQLELEGVPVVGNQLLFKNMGAYTWDMPMQFEANDGLKIEFMG